MKLHEYEPVGGNTESPRAIHREDSSVLTCATCGCRLTPRESVGDGGLYGPDAAWRHFPGFGSSTDARGCRVACMDRPHRLRDLD